MSTTRASRPDRELKDTYLFYKTVLSSTPQLVIGNREWQNCRSGRRLGPLHTTRAGLHQPAVGDPHPQRSQGRTSVRNRAWRCSTFRSRTARTVSWPGPGAHRCPDRRFPAGAGVAERFTELNVMLGSPRYFDDREAGLAWIPEQPYTPGSWGYVGGRSCRSGTGFGSVGHPARRTSPSSRPSVSASSRSARRARGSALLHLLPNFRCCGKRSTPRALAYNLGSDGAQQHTGRRFDVSVNGQKVLENFDRRRGRFRGRWSAKSTSSCATEPGPARRFRTHRGRTRAERHPHLPQPLTPMNAHSCSHWLLSSCRCCQRPPRYGLCGSRNCAYPAHRTRTDMPSRPMQGDTSADSPRGLSSTARASNAPRSR